MDYNFLIHEYLDGTLDKASESQLFMALSSSDELRNELKQAITMDKGLSKRVSAFVPSSSSTLNVFSQLGIGAGLGAASTTAALGFKSSILSFFSTYSTAIISTIVGIAVTSGLFLGFYNPSDSYSQERIIAMNSSDSKMENSETAFLSQTSQEQIFPRPLDVYKTDTVVKFVKQQYILPESEKQTAIESDIEDKFDTGFDSSELLTFSDIPNSKQEVRFETKQVFHQRYLPESNYEQYKIAFPSVINNLSLEVKGNGYKSIPSPEVSAYPAGLLSNMQVSALYDFGNGFKAGLDFRQESYYQSFSGTNEIGESFIYRQNPNYYSLGILTRYNLYESTYFNTFSQLYLGGTVTGAVSRLMMGIEFLPDSPISFILGFEGSMLSYYHQKILFNSPKIGLNYGVAFNF